MAVIDLDTGSISGESEQPQGGVIDLDTGQYAEEPTIEPQAEKSEGTALDVVYEPLKAVASGLAGTIAGGLGGAVTAPFAGAEKAAEVVTETQQAAAELGAPETQRGEQALETLGDIMQKGVDLARFPISGLAGLASLITGQGIDEAAQTVQDVKDRGLGKVAGEKAFEVTGSPLAAAIAEVSPELALSFIPIKGMVAKRSAFKEKIVEQIKAGGTDKTLAKYMINGSGKLKTDKIAQESVKQGFDQGVIAAVKGSSKVDRAKMSKMVETMKKGKENALFAMKNRPSDIAGDSLLDRVKYIKQINRTAGKQVDDVAKSLKGQKVDFDTPINNFMDNLDEMGVRLDGRFRPIFKGSDIEGLQGPQAAINNIVKRLSSGKRGVPPDAYELHRMKRYIDEIVTYGKTGEGLTGKTERILKKLRVDLDDALDTKFKAYKEANTTYAETVGALDSLQDVAGRKMDLFGPNADKAIGTLLRRMMSNVQSRVNLVDSVDNLDSIAKKYGANFSDDISIQMLFADELDTVFGPVARTSLARETAKGFKKGAEAVAGNRTVTGAAIDAAAQGVEKLRGINQENAFKSITELLTRE